MTYRVKISPLAHGWRLEDRARAPRELISEFIEPAAASTPRTAAARLGSCLIALVQSIGETGDATSRWTTSESGLEIELAIAGAAPHDIALEMLFAIGQAIWESALPSERASYLELLSAEIAEGVDGEIDEDAVAEKRRLFTSPVLARSPRRLERYAAVSFAGAFAEYVHSMWHDVTVREGPQHLPPERLRARFELLARLFPPDPGQRLFENR